MNLTNIEYGQDAPLDLIRAKMTSLAFAFFPKVQYHPLNDHAYTIARL